MPNVLIVGATRGLGASLVNAYAFQPDTTVYATARSLYSPERKPNIEWIVDIDLLSPTCCANLLAGFPPPVPDAPPFVLDTVIISAGFFPKESLTGPPGVNWDAEIKTYTLCSVAPAFLIHGLFHEGLLKEGSKVFLVSSEAGSITLRHETEGGGNFAHHGSKAALNMVGKLLSLDLKERGVAVGMIHPGFMRTDMTKGVGFDQFYDSGGAVTPDEAAKSLVEFAKIFDMPKTGQFWAPRGPRDIGTAPHVMGNDLPTPLQLPW